MIKVSLDYLATLGSTYLLRIIDEKLPNYVNDPIVRHALLRTYSIIDSGVNEEVLNEAISVLKNIFGNEIEVEEKLIK